MYLIRPNIELYCTCIQIFVGASVIALHDKSFFSRGSDTDSSVEVFHRAEVIAVNIPAADVIATLSMAPSSGTAAGFSEGSDGNGSEDNSTSTSTSTCTSTSPQRESMQGMASELTVDVRFFCDDYVRKGLSAHRHLKLKTAQAPNSSFQTASKTPSISSSSPSSSSTEADFSPLLEAFEDLRGKILSFTRNQRQTNPVRRKIPIR